jgi:alpha-ketoglutaric semialdehyde dehydrogenase
MNMYTDVSASGINEVMERSATAFQVYRKCSLLQRASFMRKIAEGLQSSADTIIPVTMRESHLPEARLRNELGRTVFQLNSYAEAAAAGQWLEASIDTADLARTPPKADIRKMLVPLGPVVVFGSSNFPFAYSTAGGDTASAFAAGCTVVVKAHPAHPETSTMVAGVIAAAVTAAGLPEDIFQHVHGASFEVGKALVMHERTKAVGFTGSFTGGKALSDWATQRKEPIPVFAEMGSTNPVILLPGKLSAEAETLAKQLAGSITLGVGQFCTKPGLIIGISGRSLHDFTRVLSEEISNIAPAPMLHEGIVKAYGEKRSTALARKGIKLLSQSLLEGEGLQGRPTLASVPGNLYLADPILHQEVFGPWSLVIECADEKEMAAIVGTMEGQLTATVMATEEDIHLFAPIVETLREKCGRFIYNGVPTGVEVCLSMHHGGPYPSTTDSRYTSVGADALKRFARPLSFQNWPDGLLPEELRNENPLGVWRTVNNHLTKVPV